MGVGVCGGGGVHMVILMLNIDFIDPNHLHTLKLNPNIIYFRMSPILGCEAIKLCGYGTRNTNQYPCGYAK